MSVLLIKCIPVGQIETNCYVVTDENTLECAVIDPGDECNPILDYIEENHLRVKAIMLTHGHFDHTGAIEEIVECCGAPVYICQKDTVPEGTADMFRYAAPAGTRFYSEGGCVTVGALTFVVMETPGHSPGSVVLRCGDALFTGDTLFCESCGRTDLPGGDMQILMASLARLAAIPGDLEVFPGHGDSSTLEREKRFNYYLRMAAGEI